MYMLVLENTNHQDLQHFFHPFRLFARSSARSDASLSLVRFARLDASPSGPDAVVLGFAVALRSGLVDRCSMESMC
jgi:hypothetical protein